MTREVSICQRHSSPLQINVGFHVCILLVTALSRMVLLNERTALSRNTLLPCFMKLVYLLHSWVRLLTLTLQFRINAPLIPSRRKLHLNFGTSANQMSQISEFGVVQLTFTSRRISVLGLALTWRKVFSSATQRDSKPGNSTIL